MMNQDKKC